MVTTGKALKAPQQGAANTAAAQSASIAAGLSAPSVSINPVKTGNGFYWPAIFNDHPSKISDEIYQSYEAGEKLYCTIGSHKFFVISKEQEAKGMVHGTNRFPCAANLIEIFE